MKNSEDQKAQDKTDEYSQKLHADLPRRLLDSTVIILVMVGFFAFVGRYLDGVLGTHPWLFIAGIVIAFPLSQYLIYIRIKKRYKL